MKSSNSFCPNIVSFPQISKRKAYSSYFPAHYLEMMQKIHAFFLVSDKFTNFKKKIN